MCKVFTTVRPITEPPLWHVASHCTVFARQSSLDFPIVLQSWLLHV